MGGGAKPGPAGRDTEPELSVVRGEAKPEFFKVFPCALRQMERPAFKTCRTFQTCRELTSEQRAALGTALPEGTRAVMACARSPKGPAHLLALRRSTLLRPGLRSPFFRDPRFPPRFTASRRLS